MNDPHQAGLTVSSTLVATIRRLAAHSLTPRLDAEILLAHACGQTRSWLRAWPEHELDDAAQARYNDFIDRRAAGEPVAYITGTREFWSLELRVTPATLIPRPETERLVELALERIPADARWRIADLGTGSGAIAIAIAHERRNCRIVATDTSPDALAVAADNARRLDIDNIEFRHGDWCAALGTDRFELIASNPPYIAAHDPHLAQGDLRFEPGTALTPGGDGLAALRAIVAQARRHLHPPGWLILEHGYGQAAAVAELLTAAGYVDIAGYTDLAGQDRISLGRHAA